MAEEAEAEAVADKKKNPRHCFAGGFLYRCCYFLGGLTFFVTLFEPPASATVRVTEKLLGLGNVCDGFAPLPLAVPSPQTHE